jgi:hypothetical protein
MAKEMRCPRCGGPLILQGNLKCLCCGRIIAFLEKDGTISWNQYLLKKEANKRNHHKVPCFLESKTVAAARLIGKVPHHPEQLCKFSQGYYISVTSATCRWAEVVTPHKAKLLGYDLSSAIEIEEPHCGTFLPITAARKQQRSCGRTKVGLECGTEGRRAIA